MGCVSLLILLFITSNYGRGGTSACIAGIASLAKRRRRILGLRCSHSNGVVGCKSAPMECRNSRVAVKRVSYLGANGGLYGIAFRVKGNGTERDETHYVLGMKRRICRTSGRAICSCGKSAVFVGSSCHTASSCHFLGGIRKGCIFSRLKQLGRIVAIFARTGSDISDYRACCGCSGGVGCRTGLGLRTCIVSCSKISDFFCFLLGLKRLEGEATLPGSVKCYVGRNLDACGIRTGCHLSSRGPIEVRILCGCAGLLSQVSLSCGPLGWFVKGCGRICFVNTLLCRIFLVCLVGTSGLVVAIT